MEDLKGYSWEVILARESTGDRFIATAWVRMMMGMMVWSRQADFSLLMTSHPISTAKNPYSPALTI